MKSNTSFILMFMIFVLSSCGLHDKKWDKAFPAQPTSFVNDLEGILTNEEEKTLEDLLRDFEEKSTIQIAIVTLDSSWTTKKNFYQYTLDLANYWGVGQKETDNGILIGVSESLKIMRIQNGLGIEKLLTDEETQVIVDSFFIPEFKGKNFYGGLLNGTKKLMEKIE